MSSPADRITEAAIRVFRKKGIEDARMEDIAQEAKLARANMYRYVKNKEDVVKLVVMHRARYILHELKPREGIWHEVLTDLFVKQVQLAMHDEIFLMVVEQAGAITAKLFVDDDAFQTSLNKVISPVLAQGRAAGEIREGLSEEEILYWLHYQTWCLTRDPRLHTTIEIKTLARKFVVGGLLAPGVLEAASTPPAIAKLAVTAAKKRNKQKP